MVWSFQSSILGTDKSEVGRVLFSACRCVTTQLKLLSSLGLEDRPPAVTRTDSRPDTQPRRNVSYPPICLQKPRCWGRLP